MEKKYKNLEDVLIEADKRMLAEPQAVLELLLESKKLICAETDEDLVNDLHYKTAQVQNLCSLYEEAEATLLELLGKYEKSHYSKGIAKVCNELGNGYWARGDLNGALEYYLKCLEIMEAVEDHRNMCIPLNNVGQIYWYNKDFAKAKAAYLRSQEFAAKYCPDLEGDPLTNLGILCAESGDYALAEQYYNRALAVYESLGAEANIALLHMNLALLYEDTDEDEKAMKFNFMAINSYQKIKYPRGEMHARMNYAGFLLKRQKYEEALPVLETSLQLAEEIGAKNQIIQLYQHLSEYYKETGDWENAFVFYEKFHNAEVDRLDENNREKLTEMLTRYETEQKEKEAKLLREQNIALEQKNHQINSQKEELDLANKKLTKANLELENRIEKLLQSWHEQEMIERGGEDLGALEKIVSSIAHQWKQPLNAISIIIQNLIDAYEFDELSDELFDDFQEQIFKQFKYMTNIVNDYAYGFKQSLQSDDFDLEHAVRLAVGLMRKSLELESVTLHVDIKSYNQINGSESKFIQVLMVILSNAIDVFQNKKQENPEMRITVDHADGMAEIELFNTGDNISEKVLANIFDAFFSTKKTGKNTGLGLTLAKKIIEEDMKGKVICQNRDRGVSFIISLPVKEKNNK